MAYDETLAERVRNLLSKRTDVVEKRMFGGLTFMIRGNMCCGVVGDDLMVRVGPERHEAALREPHARPMDFTGRPSKGMVYVDYNGTDTAEQLSTWVTMATDFVLTLPAK